LMRHAVHGEGVEPDFLGHADRRPPRARYLQGIILQGIVPIPRALARQIARLAASSRADIWIR
jgi:hypothetical protein